jgi:hypothetical protein
MNAYQVPMARRLRFEASRRWEPLPMNLWSVALADELRDSEGALDAKLERAIATKDLPPTYFEDEVVRSGRKVHPYSIYMDKVPFTRTDSILGIVGQHLLSDTRHLIFSIRNTEICGCGCKGLCTLQPLFEALAWDVEAMRKGRRQRRRHDGQEFGVGEEYLSGSAGLDLGFASCCFTLKADWSEGCTHWAHPVGGTLIMHALCALQHAVLSSKPADSILMACRHLLRPWNIRRHAKLARYILCCSQQIYPW